MLDPMPRKDVTLPPTAREAELTAEIERLSGWLAFIEGGAGLTGDAARAVAAAALDGRPAPTRER